MCHVVHQETESNHSEIRVEARLGLHSPTAKVGIPVEVVAGNFRILRQEVKHRLPLWILRCKREIDISAGFTPRPDPHVRNQESHPLFPLLVALGKRSPPNLNVGKHICPAKFVIAQVMALCLIDLSHLSAVVLVGVHDNR